MTSQKLRDLNLVALVAAVRQIALADPDHIYQYPDDREDEDDVGSCVYFAPDGTPSCVVGHGMARLGVTADDLEPGDNRQPVNYLLDVTPGALADNGPGPALLWLQKMQYKQDAEEPWGVGVEDADEMVPEIEGHPISEFGTTLLAEDLAEPATVAGSPGRDHA